MQCEGERKGARGRERGSEWERERVSRVCSEREREREGRERE